MHSLHLLQTVVNALQLHHFRVAHFYPEFPNYCLPQWITCRVCLVIRRLWTDTKVSSKNCTRKHMEHFTEYIWSTILNLWCTLVWFCGSVLMMWHSCCNNPVWNLLNLHYSLGAAAVIRIVMLVVVFQCWLMSIACFPFWHWYFGSS